MTITSRIVGKWMHLSPAQTHDIVVTRDIPIPMPDGVILFADHYASRNGIRQPTILFRSPYGRSGIFGSQSARTYAERGFQVLVQSCRAQQAQVVNSIMHAMSTMMDWQPLNGSSVRTGFLANWSWSVEATSVLCSGLWLLMQALN